jgi:transposase-like protein
MSKRSSPDELFKGRHGRPFLAEVIVLSVRWYLYKLSSRDIWRLMAQREISVDHSTILSWVAGACRNLKRNAPLCASHPSVMAR